MSDTVVNSSGVKAFLLIKVRIREAMSDAVINSSGVKAFLPIEVPGYDLRRSYWLVTNPASGRYALYTFNSDRTGSRIDILLSFRPSAVL